MSVKALCVMYHWHTSVCICACLYAVISSARKINIAKFHDKTAMVMVVTDVAVSIKTMSVATHPCPA